MKICQRIIYLRLASRLDGAKRRWSIVRVRRVVPRTPDECCFKQLGGDALRADAAGKISRRCMLEYGLSIG